MTAAHTFGRYRVTGTLGAGAMGEVFAAVDEVLGREVAVKTLKGHKNGLAARILDERFRQEARAIAALAHPGVVQVFDIDLEADPPYLVMERVAGPSLKERFATGRLEVDELRALGIQIGRALAAAHTAKIIHRDVKPANILIAGDRSWKLADFGVAHIPDSSLTMTGQFVGSPAYAPPEALVRGQSDAEGDVYGLGATLYQAAAGRWPRLDDTSGALIPIVPPLAQLAPELPAEIAALIDRAVANDPTERPTASELADVLAGAASSPGVARPSAAVPAPAYARASSTADGTAAYADASVPGVMPVALPVPARAPIRWQPWAAVAVGVLMIGVIAATRDATGPGSPAHPAAAALRGQPSGTPATGTDPLADLTVVPPEMATPQQAEDWNDMVDQLDRRNWSKALDKLDDWEERYGETPETEALKRHLDVLKDRDPGRKGKGKGKRGRGRD